MLIDTGMNRQECEAELTSCLKKLDVDLENTDFFITHWHVDHLGLVSSLARGKAKIYFNRAEAFAGDRDKRWQENIRVALLHGFPEGEPEKAFRVHPGSRYGPKEPVDFSFVAQGDKLEIGDYSFECIETPGHSPCHICLYEPAKKILISGDHILSDITPNITIWSNGVNPLKTYLMSLDKVYTLDVNIVLPGHRNVFSNHRKRIQELKEHHETRANEVVKILEKGGLTAYEIASQMTWDIDCESWELYPISQKWFAGGEALSHLKYLEEKGIVYEERQEQKVVFLLSNRKNITLH